jgi:mono/diheme cytochrome c family protein
MRNFFLGVLVTFTVLILGGLGIALLGFIPTNANTDPPKFERHLAMSAVDASADRHAPRVSSPVAATDQNLIDGMKIYTMNCAGCHGGLDKKPAAFGGSFYPPVPQLVLDPPDDPDWHNYYVVRNGIRYTGMPAWDKTLKEEDIWKVTIFLSHMQKLPAAAQDYWKNAFGVTPPAAEGGHGEHDEH